MSLFVLTNLVNQECLVRSLHVDGQFLKFHHFLFSPDIKAAADHRIRIHEVRRAAERKSAHLSGWQLGQEVLTFLGIGQKNFESGLVELKLHVSSRRFGNFMLHTGAAREDEGCQQIKDSMID